LVVDVNIDDNAILRLRICGPRGLTAVFTICVSSATVASVTAALYVEPRSGVDSAMTPTSAIGKVSKAERRTAAASSVMGRGLPERR